MHALFARHNVRVFRFLMGRVRNEATAEELTNEVFLDVWRLASRYEGPRSGIHMASGHRTQQGDESVAQEIGG